MLGSVGEVPQQRTGVAVGSGAFDKYVDDEVGGSCELARLQPDRGRKAVLADDDGDPESLGALGVLGMDSENLVEQAGNMEQSDAPSGQRLFGPDSVSPSTR